MEKENMMEIEVMDDAFNLNSAEEEAAMPVVDTEADVHEEEVAGCDCEEEVSKPCKKEILMQKCAQVKNACKKTAGRLKDNWKTCGTNADVRATASCKIELFKKGEEETPVDSVSAERSISFSLRTAALVGAAALVVGCCVGLLSAKSHK